MAAATGLPEAIAVLEQAADRTPENRALLERHRRRLEMTREYDVAYRRYNWPVDTINDLKIAPFQIMATEGAVHWDKPHSWHMTWAERFARKRPDPDRHRLQGRRPREPRGGQGNHRLVARQDDRRRRRHGRETRRALLQAAGPRRGLAGDQVPRQAVPPDHLRTGVQPTRRTWRSCAAATRA